MDNQIKSFTVKKSGRLDEAIADALNISRSKAQLIVDNGIEIKGRNRKASYKVEEGDVLNYTPLEEKPTDIVPNADIVVPVVYEDDDVIIINKPSGMLSQKAVPEDISANEYILSYLIRKGSLSEEQFKTFKPSICNRLDRNTSGLLIAGKTLKGLQTMAEALKKRTVQKYYRCIVKGELREKTHLKGYLSKDEQNNKVKVVSHIRPEEKADYLPIETEYRPVAVSNGYTELEVHLITGRSHQIRAHLASIGHPIVGDGKYGDLRTNERFRKEVHVRSQLLHAYRIVLEDGREVIAPSGREFEDAWDYIQTSAF
jgi:23S rRNA pseudouridine955/2504/2580 synthase